jgi:tRNA(Ile)-lysidine synthase
MAVLRGNLAERVAEIITRYNMVSPGERVGVAVSGGADSVVLLHLLHALSSELSLRLTVLHVNHGLRGAESDADEEFVRVRAASLDLPVLVERTGPLTGNLEQAARQARRDFFRRAVQEHSLDHIALGHTQSDQAETVLFRLVRGSGLAGLAGMRFVTHDGLIRPLLSVSRVEVRGWAASMGIIWREDSSNMDLRFSRNRLRNRIVPELLEHFNSNLEAVMAETAALASAEEEYWAEQIEPVFQQICRPGRFGLIADVRSLAALHVAIRRRVLRRAACEVRGDLRSLDLRHFQAILRVCESERAHDRVIVPGLDALRSYDKLRLCRPGDASGQRGYELGLALEKECELPFGAGTIYLDPLERDLSFCVNFKEDQEFSSELAELDVDALPGQGTAYPLAVRNWEPGDAIQLPGHMAADKVKSLFQEHRILLWERRHWPVVVSGGEIVWVRRFGTAAKFCACDQTRQRIRLLYRSPE